MTMIASSYAGEETDQSTYFGSPIVQAEPPQIPDPHSRAQPIHQPESESLAPAIDRPAPRPADAGTAEVKLPYESQPQSQPDRNQRHHDAESDLDFTPETAGEARHALLNEPMVRIHSLSHPDDFTDLEDLTIRPVVAESSERHVPKDDLLTPQDLAKAFQLEFGLQSGDPTKAYRIPGQLTRQIKFVLSGTAALLIACLATLQAIHLLSPEVKSAVYIKPAAILSSSSMKDTAAAIAKTAPAPHLNSDDARLASNTAFAPSPAAATPIVPIIVPAPPVHPPAAPVLEKPKTEIAIAPSPARQPMVDALVRKLPGNTSPTFSSPINNGVNNPVTHPVVTNIMMVEPTPTATDADNPANLLKAGIAAEAAGNYLAAIRLYERIQSLPGEMWPPHLATRLQLAREELKGDLH